MSAHHAYTEAEQRAFAERALVESATTVGRDAGVSGQTIRNWCEKFKLGPVRWSRRALGARGGNRENRVKQMVRVLGRKGFDAAAIVKELAEYELADALVERWLETDPDKNLILDGAAGAKPAGGAAGSPSPGALNPGAGANPAPSTSGPARAEGASDAASLRGEDSPRLNLDGAAGANPAPSAEVILPPAVGVSAGVNPAPSIEAPATVPPPSPAPRLSVAEALHVVFGGLDAPEELKALAVENARLRDIIVDQAARIERLQHVVDKRGPE